MNSIKDKLHPEDFQTHSHYWSTFGRNESEVSAYWVVIFLQHRNAQLRDSGSEPTDNGWGSFTYDEINEFYKTRRNNRDCNITFNTLINSDKCSPLTVLKIDNEDKWRLAGQDVITVTDWFVCGLASQPHMFKKDKDVPA